MNKYKYPDPGDHITYTTISKYECNRKDYWCRSESLALSRIANILSSKGGLNDSMLDIGCGEGRLLDYFGKYFNAIYAIEPDKDRFRNVKLLVKQWPDSNKFELSDDLFLDFKGGPFDFILCSHVIQHISTEDLLSFMKNIYKIGKNKAIVAVTTTHSNQEHDIFIKSEILNNRIVDTKISPSEFNTIVEGQIGLLPICFFNAEKLIALFTGLGLELLDYYVFHVENVNVPNKPDDVFVDEFINSRDDLKKKYGRDMLLIFQKSNHYTYAD